MDFLKRYREILKELGYKKISEDEFTITFKREGVNENSKLDV